MVYLIQFVYSIITNEASKYSCCSFFVVQLIAHCCSVVTFWKLWSELMTVLLLK